jgi:hypothetical protein
MKIRAVFALILGLVLGALVFAGAGFGRGTATLKGVVGPGYTISLTKAGHAVKTLRPGRYTFSIRDRSSFHDFTLEKTRGGNFEKHLTTINFTGAKTVTVKLTKGRWEFYCSLHEPQMHHTFLVK